MVRGMGVPLTAVLGSKALRRAAGPATTATVGDCAMTLRTPSPSPSTAIQKGEADSA